MLSLCACAWHVRVCVFMRGSVPACMCACVCVFECVRVCVLACMRASCACGACGACMRLSVRVRVCSI